MSETVHYKGTLTKFEKQENETLEDQCKRLSDNKEIPSYYDSYIEFFSDEYYQHYIIIDNDIYSISKKSIDIDDEIFESKRINKHVIEFQVKYYNGGCNFNEAIEEALKK